MNRSLALRAVAHRKRIAALDDQTAIRAEMFMRAWEGLKGFGEPKDGKWQEWTTSERIAPAQKIAWWAIHRPLWTPSIKRWKGRETV